MNIKELQFALLEIEKQIDDITKTNVVLGDRKIIINNTGQDYSEPVRWELDEGKLITIREQELL